MAGVSPTTDDSGWVDLRGPPTSLSVRSRSTRSSMDLGPDPDASNIRDVTSAPASPPICFHRPAADFRGLFHRRVQFVPIVCCNDRYVCSFLGFCSPPRLSCRTGAPPSRVSRRRAVSRWSIPVPVSTTLVGGTGLLRCSVRTVARGRLFDPRAASVAGRGLLGVFHVKERLSRLRRSWPRPVKKSALAALSVTDRPEIGRAHV